MNVGGYDFPEFALDLAANTGRWPAVYAGDRFGKHSISFEAKLLPADVAGNLFKVSKNGLVRASAGRPPLVTCADMPWLVRRLEETQASNRHPDHIFMVEALRLTIAPVPLRWIMSGWNKPRHLEIQCDEQAVSLLLERVEIIKPKEDN